MRFPHELKTWPGEFQAVLDGLMPFQLRRNDRDFKVGDELLLREWEPEPSKRIPPFTDSYTGRELLVRVDYIMDTEGASFVARGWENVSPLAPGYVIMSVSFVS